MRRILLSFVACLDLLYFFPYLVKFKFFLGGGNLLKMKCVLIFSTTFYGTFLFVTRIQRGVINVRRSSCKMPVVLVTFQ